MELMDVSAIAIAVAIMLGVPVLFRVFASPAYSPAQKLLQSLLIVLVPVIGACVAWAVMREDSRVVKPCSGERFDPPMNPPGIG